ncbi:MAG: tetratricopeptide repeat protein [Cytophagales bacterium]|nr:tetratricopeptide repeat protein [Bernardetiaceae bacterium]MDW8204833.1 tetratricopeptide repeat protein [Cytophagales bacterium]
MCITKLYCLFLTIFLPLFTASANDSPKMLANKALLLYEKDLLQAYQLALKSWHLSQHQNNIEHRAWVHLALGITYKQKGNFDSAFLLLNGAEQLFRRQNLLKETTWALTEAGSVRSQQSSFVEAHQLLTSAIQTLRKISPNSAQMAEAHRELGLNYLRRQLLKQSFLHLDTAKKIYEQLNDNYGLARTLNNIGLCYRNMDDAENALKSYLQALDAFEKLKDPPEQWLLCSSTLLTLTDSWEIPLPVQWTIYMHAPFE